jgi:hypothetical protein
MANDTRPIQFFDHLPNLFRADEFTQFVVESVSDKTVTVVTFNSGAIEIPTGAPVFVFSKALSSTLIKAIPANRAGLTRIEVRDGWFAAVLQTGDVLSVPSFLSRFLQTLETLFEELQAAIEGTPGGILILRAIPPVSGTLVPVDPFDSRAVEFPVGTPITVAGKSLRATLKVAIPANSTGLTRIRIRNSSIAAALEEGDFLMLHPGGIPDLFSPNTTPPPQFKHRPKPDFNFVNFFDFLNHFAYLNYLASWIALPLRAEKSADWNRRFFNAAIPLYAQRGTLPGMDALLRAWLKDDLLETDPPLLILTDLTRTCNDADAVFQLAPEDDRDRKPGETYAQLGLTTSLGEGPPFFFIADLVTDPTVKALRNPAGLDLFVRAARFLLDAEKPAHTYYQLRVRARTMQLAPPRGQEVKGEIYAQVGATTLLWDEPCVFDSDS